MKFPVVCCIIRISLLVKLKPTTADEIIFELDKADDFEKDIPSYYKIGKPNYKTTINSKNNLADEFMYNIYFILKRNKNDLGASVDLKKVAGTRIKKFKPYTRPKFSEDYVDISDFNFNRDTNVKKNDSPKPTLKDSNVYNLLLQVVARKMVPLQKGTEQVDEDFSNESEKSDDNADGSEEEEGKDIDNEEVIPKRFEIINNSVEASSDKESDDDENNDEVKELYMQAPTRFVKSKDLEWRRRLRNFLPKRVHWEENDYKNLRNFWIGGSRGKYSG